MNGTLLIHSYARLAATVGYAVGNPIPELELKPPTIDAETSAQASGGPLLVVLALELALAVMLTLGAEVDAGSVIDGEGP